MAKGNTAPGTGERKNRKGTKEAPSSSNTEADVVKRVIKNIEERLESEEIKATLGDFIRLVQLRKELEEELPREIEVTWVEPSEKEPAP